MIKKVLIAGLAAVTLFSAGVLAGDVVFNDVSEDDWYHDSAVWAAEMGLMEGNEGNFRGSDNVTRAELAEVFSRYYAAVEMAEDESADEAETVEECTTETVTDEETGEETEVETCVEVESTDEESTDEESTDEESTDESAESTEE